jgi:hypothetical protein
MSVAGDEVSGVTAAVAVAVVESAARRPEEGRAAKGAKSNKAMAARVFLNTIRPDPLRFRIAHLPNVICETDLLRCMIS